MTYLIHFNKNHSKANGRFVSGDGDGDGVVNDRKQAKAKARAKLKKTRKKILNEWKTDIKSSRDNFKKKSTSEKVLSGLNAVASVAPIVEIGVNVVHDNNMKKINAAYAQQEEGRRFVEDIQRASFAKYAGGDW